MQAAVECQLDRGSAGPRPARCLHRQPACAAPSRAKSIPDSAAAALALVRAPLRAPGRTMAEPRGRSGGRSISGCWSAIAARRPGRLALARAGRGAEAARRRLHQAGQDDHHPGHLPHRRHRHRRHGGPEGVRPGRRQGDGLFPHRLDAGARDRPRRRQSRPAGRGPQRRSGDARRRARSPPIVEPGARAERHRLPAQHHPRHACSAPSPRARSCRCCSSRSCSASRWR